MNVSQNGQLFLYMVFDFSAVSNRNYIKTQ